jgi:hypothetical protein
MPEMPALANLQIDCIIETLEGKTCLASREKVDFQDLLPFLEDIV